MGAFSVSPPLASEKRKKRKKAPDEYVTVSASATPAGPRRAFRSGLAIASLGAAHQPAHRARCQGRQAASHSRKGRAPAPSWSFPILQAHQPRTGRGLKRRDHGKQLAYLGRDRRAIFNANATQGPRKAASPLIALSALVSRAKLLRVNSSSARSSPHPSVKYTVVLPNATHGTVHSSLQAAFSWRWRDVQTGPGASFAIPRPCHLLDTAAIDSYAHRAHYRWVSK